MNQIPHDEHILNKNSFLHFVKKCDPVFKLHLENTKITVYRAKNMLIAEWENLFARRIVIEIRKRFREFYGKDIPLEDKYDQKASIYFIHIEYTVEARVIHEW